MNQKELIEDIRDIVFAYDDEEIFSELRVWIDDTITDQKLQESLQQLVDECEADYEEKDMILSVLESEIECYFSNIETRSK
jgi:transcriptional regulator CtsR